MARTARVVVAEVPHHVVQRGNRRQPVFFSTADYKAYLRLTAAWCGQKRVDVWAYCLMPNHVHLGGLSGTVTVFERPDNPGAGGDSGRAGG